MFGTIARCIIVLILAFSQCLRACADLSLLKTTSRINSFLNNGGQELIRRHLGLSKHVHYHPFAHFTRDEPSYSRDEAMRRIADAERVSDVQLLRSMGVYFPGIDHDSMLTSGQVSRQLNMSLQFLNQRAVVRGKLSVFEVAYDPSTPFGVRRAFEYSLGIWGRVFKSKTPLRVRFKWEPFQGRTLAATQSPFSIVGGTPETPDLMSGTSYTPVLALVLQGADFLPRDRFHISISFNSRQLWHTDLSQNAPAGRFDLATVALHEQCHALFFSGSALGRPQLGVANFESIDYLPSRFDHFMQTRKGVGVARSCAGAQLFKALTTPGLRFRTTTGRSSFGLYAPRRYSRGSSTYHFAAAQLQRDCQSQNIPDRECSDLMTYELETQYTMRNIGEPTLRVMRSVLGSSAGLRKEKCVIPPALRGSEDSGYQPGVLGPDAKSGKPFRLPMSVIITAGALGAVGTVTVIYFIVTAIVGRRS